MSGISWSAKGTARGGGGGRIAVIFVAVTAVSAAGIWFLMRASAPQKQPEVPEVAEAVPEKMSPAVPEEAVAGEKEIPAETVSPAEQESALPSGRPEIPVPAEEQSAGPPEFQKGVVSAADPADEDPYFAPDALEPGGFAANLDAIKKLLAEKKILPAGSRIRALMKETSFSSAQYREAAEVLNKIASEEFAAEIRAGTGKTQVYTVQPGDALIRLARKWNLAAAHLAAVNRLKPDAGLKTGQKLVIPQGIGTWRIIIRKRARLLALYRNGVLNSVFDVGIGRQDRTPAGDFLVREIVDDPEYPLPEGGVAPAGSPENQLGPCWIGLGDLENNATGYGIHGAADESTVTRSLSHGCVRMRNHEVKILRGRIPVGTPVTIEN